MNKSYSTKQIADLIGIHVNTVRFYENIGFLSKPVRKQNGYREYNDLHLLECKLIRLANYSLVAILRLLNSLDDPKENNLKVEYVLNTPSEEEDIISVCDQLIVSLENTYQDALTIDDLLLNIKKLNKETLQ